MWVPLSGDCMEISPEYIGSELRESSGQVPVTRAPSDSQLLPLLLMETTEQNLTACQSILFFHSPAWSKDPS